MVLLDFQVRWIKWVDPSVIWVRLSYAIFTITQVATTTNAGYRMLALIASELTLRPPVLSSLSVLHDYAKLISPC